MVQSGSKHDRVSLSAVEMQKMLSWPAAERLIQGHLIQLSGPVKQIPSSSSALNVQRSNGGLDAGELGAMLDSLNQLIFAVLSDGGECSKNFCSLQFRPAFGHLVSLMLDVFGDEKRDSVIRLKAADLLLLLTRKSFGENVGKFSTADSMAVVLPGFFLRCKKIAVDCSNAAVSYKISERAIYLITSVITLTLGGGDSIISSPRLVDFREANSQLNVERDEAWMGMAASRIEPQLFTLVSQLCANSNSKIRRAVFRLLLELRENCGAVLSAELTFNALVDVCVTMSSDSDKGIRSLASNTLAKLRHDDENGEIAVQRYLSEKLVRTTKNLSQKLRDSSSGFEVFQNFVNCVNALGVDGLERLITASSNFLDSILVEIFASICVDKKRLLISAVPTNRIDESSDRTTKSTAVISMEQELMNFYRNVSLCNGLRISQILDLSKTFVQMQNVDVIFNAVIDKFKLFDWHNRSSAIILLTCISALIPPSTLSEAVDCLQSFATFILEFTEPLKESLESEISDQKIEDSSSISSHSPQTILLSVALYGVIVGVSQMIRRKCDALKITELKINAVYELLTWSSSSNHLVKTSAEFSLELLAKVVGFDSAGDFLCANAEHVIFKVALHAHDFSRYPCSPRVVSELLARSTFSSGNCESDTPKKWDHLFEQISYVIDELLFALDRYNQNKTTLILRAIRNYIRVLRRWFPDLKPAPFSPPNHVVNANDDVDDDGRDRSPLAENNDDDESKEEEFEKICQVMEEKRQKSSLMFPPIESAVKALNRTKHMISSTFLPIQLLVLDILDDCIYFVRNFEDELLPMIHQNWHGLVRKFDGISSASTVGDSQKIAAARSIRVIVTMCQLSKSFVYQKITNELSPRVCNFLQNSAMVFDKMLPSTASSYHQTALYQLQLSMIEAMPTIVAECELSSEHSAPFLSALQRFAPLSESKTPKIAALGRTALISLEKMCETKCEEVLDSDDGED